jgi:CRP-like cAMP-binding protein
MTEAETLCLEPTPFLTYVETGQSGVSYRPKEAIFRQGEAADAVFYIEKGRVHISVISDHGKEGIITILRPGAFFGEECLAGQGVRMASATAEGKAVVIRIGKAEMTRGLHEQPAFMEKFMAFLLSRNIEIEADLVDQLFNSSERRLARVLLLLADFDKPGNAEAVIPKISQETLAAKVGTTRARINGFMNKFRKLGFIEYNGRRGTTNGGLKVRSSLLNVIVPD